MARSYLARRAAAPSAAAGAAFVGFGVSSPPFRTLAVRASNLLRPGSSGADFRRPLRGVLPFAALVLWAAPAFAGPPEDAAEETNPGYPTRFSVDCPDAERFCPPIRTAFQDAAETLRIVKGRRVNQHPNGGYGLPLMKVAGTSLYHTGADLGWFREGEPVFAVADGIVRVSEWGLRQQLAKQGVKLPGKGPMEYGNMIVIEHREPDGSRFSSLYAHLGNDRRVKDGDLVTAGQQIGTIGRKSPMINGGYEPHLHFGILGAGYWAEGDFLFRLKAPEGHDVVVRLAEAGEVRSRVTVAPESSEPIRFDLHDRLVEIVPDGDGYSMPSSALHAFLPPGLAGRYAGYVPDMGAWRDPVAFLRDRRAHVAPAPVLIPTDLLKREDVPTRYVVGGEAPSWDVGHWRRPADDPDLDAADFRGRIVCLFVVQPNCPGCRSHGLPALAEVAARFRGDERVAVVGLQPITAAWSPASLEKSLNRWAGQLDPTVLVGCCRGVKGPPAIVKDYRIEATPWTVVIDREGVVQFSNVTVRPEEIIRRIGELLPAVPDGAVATPED